MVCRKGLNINEEREQLVIGGQVIMEEYSYIGKSILRVDAPDKVTGRAIYSSDVRLPGMLVGKCKRSPYPFARIMSIDTSQAAKLPGVRAVITAKNVVQFPYGEFASDQYPLCDQYAYYAGDEVAAVAAVDEDTAEEALELIKVDYEVLTPVLDAEEAIRAGAQKVHPELEGVEENIPYRFEFQRGDGEEGFKHADVILEERFSTPPLHHCYLQTRDCTAAWYGEKLKLWAVMQSPFRMRIPIARALGVPEDRVRIIPCTVGGGFGNNAMRIWPIAALLAREAGRPVRIALSREEDFISGRPLLSAVIYQRMGFKKDGTIVAKKADIISDTGAYVGSTRGVLSAAASRADNQYRIPHMVTSAKLVYTNKVPRGSLRGYGTEVGAFALESMVDMASAELGIDPAEIRLRNSVEKDDTTVHGFILKSCGYRESLKVATEKSRWKEKRKKQKERGEGKQYGIGLACAFHCAGNINVMRVFDGSAAMVRIDERGKASVISGELDIGPGSETVFTQIAAEETGLNIEDVKVLPVDTEISPFAMGTFASRVTVCGGHAVKMAASEARQQLLRYGGEILHVDPKDLEIRDGRFFKKGFGEPLATVAEIAQKIVIGRSGLPIVGMGEYHVPDYVKVMDEKTQYGNYSMAYTFVTQIAEVEVDPETGKVDVLKFWPAVDLGKALNPKACEAQIEGGVVMMGIGYGLSENYVVENGIIINSNFHDYKMPSFSNLPEINSMFIETIDPSTIYGAKGVAEAIGNPSAAAVANAVYDAVGVRIFDLPITPERLRNALRAKRQKTAAKSGGVNK
jgi:CO/xanthine dehydrogenase Mo-binding subunit